MAPTTARNCLSAERIEPADTGAVPGRQEQAEHLHQHDVGKMLRHQEAARLPLAKFRRQLVERPAQHRCLAGRFPHVDDRRQGAEQELGMLARKGEAAADQEKIAAAIACRDPVPGLLVDDARLDRLERQVACERERTRPRQEKAVAFLDPSRLRVAFDRDPAGAAHHRVEFDAVGRGKADGPLAAGVQTGADGAARLQQRQNVRQRIQCTIPDDHEGKTDFSAWIVQKPTDYCSREQPAGSAALREASDGRQASTDRLRIRAGRPREGSAGGP